MKIHNRATHLNQHGLDPPKLFHAQSPKAQHQKKKKPHQCNFRLSWNGIKNVGKNLGHPEI